MRKGSILVKIKYISDDGVEFDNESDCEDYEWKLNHPHLKDVHVFNAKGEKFKDIFSEDTYNLSAKIVVDTIEAAKDLQDLADYTGYNCYADITDIGEWAFDNRKGTFVKV